MLKPTRMELQVILSLKVLDNRVQYIVHHTCSISNKICKGILVVLLHQLAEEEIIYEAGDKCVSK